jgi:hypothetical protein
VVGGDECRLRLALRHLFGGGELDRHPIEDHRVAHEEVFDHGVQRDRIELGWRRAGLVGFEHLGDDAANVGRLQGGGAAVQQRHAESAGKDTDDQDQTKAQAVHYGSGIRADGDAITETLSTIRPLGSNCVERSAPLR